MIKVFAALMMLSGPAMACGVPVTATVSGGTAAWYQDETDRYPHGALGDPFEPETLRILIPDAPACGTRLTLDANHVFEDTHPRLADLNGDGTPEVITIRSHQSKGAQIAVYDANLTLLATTPYIGTRNRWLAPVGIADLDGDGTMEIAYIDRPHLAKTLRIWRFANNTLTQIATAKGLTNHRIGEPTISGGIRTCTNPPALITANANWSHIIATTLNNGTLTQTVLGPYTDNTALNAATTCN